MTPRLLDLFCGAGGAARGYQMAGFHVTGVDIKPQPHYIGEEFVQGDALEYVRNHGHEYDAIHASPPCQAFTMAGRQWRTEGRTYPDVIAAVRELLIRTHLPYVIENVPGAPLLNPVVLNGALFGMRLRRVRWFETSFTFPFPSPG